MREAFPADFAGAGDKQMRTSRAPEQVLARLRQVEIDLTRHGGTPPIRPVPGTGLRELPAQWHEACGGIMPTELGQSERETMGSPLQFPHCRACYRVIVISK